MQTLGAWHLAEQCVCVSVCGGACGPSPCVCVCTHVDVHVYICVCMYVSLRVHLCMCVYVCMYACVCMCVSVCMCVCLYLCVYLCMYVCICICVCVCVCVCEPVAHLLVTKAHQAPSCCRAFAQLFFVTGVLAPRYLPGQAPHLLRVLPNMPPAWGGSPSKDAASPPTRPAHPLLQHFLAEHFSLLTVVCQESVSPPVGGLQKAPGAPSTLCLFLQS